MYGPTFLTLDRHALEVVVFYDNAHSIDNMNVFCRMLGHKNCQDIRELSYFTRRGPSVCGGGGQNVFG